MDFADSVNYLYSLGHETLAMKFGLRNTELLLAALGNPQQSFLKIQIAGTNGKGSTAAFLEAICNSANIKTGLFTSPHLVSITERIRINGREISAAEFAELTGAVKTAAETLVAAKKLEALPTFFEHLTAIALLAFRRENVEIAILETGLGGRLDSTTAAAAEIVGITPIAFDHQEFLGNTLTEIAAEKAAIIRSGVCAVISEQKPEALQAILKKCAESSVKPIIDACRVEIDGATKDGKFTASFRTASEIYPTATLSLRGQHQLENAALAVNLAETLREFDFKISRDEFIRGLETARHAGRLEVLDDSTPQILFDGAHNAAGANSLREFLEKFAAQKKITLVFGAMRDKDLREIGAALFPIAENLIFTSIDNPRSAAPEALRQFVPPAFNRNKIYTTPHIAEALRLAREISSTDDLICITGSLYLIGAARGILKQS